VDAALGGHSANPFLYLITGGQIAILLASAFGLACWLLMMCVRAISFGIQVILAAQDAGELIAEERKRPWTAWPLAVPLQSKQRIEPWRKRPLRQDFEQNVGSEKC
jgi:hypothetical protein